MTVTLDKAPTATTTQRGMHAGDVLLFWAEADEDTGRVSQEHDYAEGSHYHVCTDCLPSYLEGVRRAYDADGCIELSEQPTGWNGERIEADGVTRYVIIPANEDCSESYAESCHQCGSLLDTAGFLGQLADQLEEAATARFGYVAVPSWRNVHPDVRGLVAEYLDAVGGDALHARFAATYGDCDYPELITFAAQLAEEVAARNSAAPAEWYAALFA